MTIIPAIDLIDGQCVRLTKGDYDTKKVYHSNPVEMAKLVEAAGFERLHVVDLDGAKAGKVINTDVIRAICSETSLKVDVGGGIKTDDDLEKTLEAGAFQVTIGSLAVSKPEQVGEWIMRFGADQIILGADVKDGKIAVNGWLDTSSVDLFDFIHDYYRKGIRHVLCTDISRDGMLTSPAFDLYESIMQRFPDLDLIASGGVSGIEDVQELTRRGIPSVVIGKAIYEGRIQLEELINYQSK